MAYSVATALVEFARINFDASRFGFLTASWHNIPEFMIILHLLFKKDTAEKVIGWHVRQTDMISFCDARWCSSQWSLLADDAAVRTVMRTMVVYIVSNL